MAIHVTKSIIPDESKYIRYVKRIFKSGKLTNNGELVQEFEHRLQDYLGVKNLLVVSNGTIALQIAYRLMGLSAVVLTTPFTFIATASSIKWLDLIPQFVDINEKTLCMEPEECGYSIGWHTSGIVPVHVYGNVCNIEGYEKLSKKHKIPIIYDAAHAFGVKYKGKSIFSYGDVSCGSLHATKIMHTIEGGFLVICDDNLYEKAKMMLNFGFDINDGGKLKCVGINAKMNEFSAAMGLCVLDEIDFAIKKRREIFDYYTDSLKNYVIFPKWNKDATMSYSYFPIIFNTSTERDYVEKQLNEVNIFPRKYFSPSLDTLNFLSNDNCRISNMIASKILCLPLYSDLEGYEVIINNVIKSLNMVGEL